MSSSPMERMAAAAHAEFYRFRFGDLEAVASCLESPLEVLAFWTVCALFRDCYGRVLPTTNLPGATKPEAMGVTLTSRIDHWAEVWPQLEVEVGEATYRLDLAFWIRHGKNSVPVAVELDGHEFHERTPEQAERDKRRDRDLQAIGWRVIRFTGSQVLRDPVGAVDEILGFAANVTRAAG